MIVSKVGRRGQIALPRDVRRALHVEEGDHIAFVRRGDEVVIYPLKRSLLDLRGTVVVEGPQDFQAVRTEVKARRAAKRAGHDA